MNEERRDEPPSLAPGLAGVGLVALVIGCCAGLPLLAALAASAALGVMLGIGAGVAALVALVGLLVFRARRRQACKAPEPSAANARPLRGSPSER